MILYHAISIYQLLLCICLRVNRATDKEAVLILPNFIRNKFSDYKLLEKYGFFTKVVLYPYDKIPLTISMENVERIGDNIYPVLQIPPLEEYEEIFCAGTHFSFASYLVAKRKHFNYIEDACGQFLDIDDFRHGQREVNMTMYLLAENNGLYDGSSPFIDKIMAHIPVDMELSDSRIVRYSLVDELKKLPVETKRKLRAIFGVKNLVHAPIEESTVFISDSAITSNLLTIEEQVLRNTLTVDYFAKQSHLIIKPHPDDYMYYRAVFPDAYVLPQQFPLELLDDFMDNSNAHALAFSSTSVRNLRTDDVKRFIWEWQMRDYRKVHRYYAAYSLYRCVEKQMTCAFAQTGPYEMVFSNWGLIPVEVDDCDGGEKSVCFFVGTDDISFERLEIILKRPKSLVIFESMNNCLIQLLRSEEIYFLSKSIEISSNRESDSHKECIYILTKNESLLALARKFHYEKQLKYTKAKVKVRDFQDNDEIFVLQDMIHAKERILKRAIEENLRLKAMME